MAIIGDVFGLTSIYERQVENIANDNFESWPESATYGYFGGGYSTPPTAYHCTIDRLDFSNETTSAPGTGLPQARSSLAAISGGASYRIKGSRTYGYFAGSNAVTVYRLDFSNETFALPGNDLT